jgi:hypothetical protein
MDLYHVDEKPQLICWDRKYYNSQEDNLLAIKVSEMKDDMTITSYNFNSIKSFYIEKGY